MNSEIKQLIKNINSGKNLNENLPAYFNMLAKCYKNYALLRGTMQYYVMCQECNDGVFIESEVKETVSWIHQTMERVFLKEEDTKVDGITELEMEREQVIRKMEVLTDDTDRLMIYEYILNRLEHKFDGKQMEEDDTVFAQTLMQYILGVKDNYIINERLKDVIGQLPIRIARSKFYERIKNSITLYKESDMESLEGYLYMLRTSATLFHPVCENKYFKQWKVFIDKLEKTDYDNINGQDWNILSEELKRIAKDINFTSETMVTLQEIINSLYVYQLMDGEEDETVLLCKTIIGESNKLAKGNVDQESEEKMVTLLSRTEGLQEHFWNTIKQLMGCLLLIKESYQEELSNHHMVEKLDDFEKADALLSASPFVEFKEENNQKVTAAVIEEETKQLLEEFTVLFREKSIRFVRAVIACILSRMPVFFTNTDEIISYIQQSLAMCQDSAEKLASYELLMGIIEEE